MWVARHIRYSLEGEGSSLQHIAGVGRRAWGGVAQEWASWPLFSSRWTSEPEGKEQGHLPGLGRGARLVPGASSCRTQRDS